VKTTAVTKLKEHQIPAPVEAVLDNVSDPSIVKLAISSAKIIKVNRSITVANMSVII
jgi:carbon monoxide dehydrogenase subunit G